ncbi:MAG TPA: SbcC/MukB-like Walker B domain-containing protein, partial [Bellilinea sp.]|nr:SbcC/MukB-like Walker B domain-containing protein [Bellilinea sp.]
QELERNVLAGQLQQNEDELAREPHYQYELKQLETELEHLTELLKSKNDAFSAAVLQETTLKSLQKSLQEKTTRFNSEQQRLVEARRLLEERLKEREVYQQALDAAPEIEKEYLAWQADRRALEHWETLAARLRTVNEKRSSQQSLIEKKRAELTAQYNALIQRQTEADARQAEIPIVESALSKLHAEADALAVQKQRMTELNDQRATVRDQVADGELQTQALSRELDLLTERIARLGESDEEVCPVCKKPLTDHERQVMVAELQGDKSTLETRVRDFTSRLQIQRSQLKSVVDQLNTLTTIDNRMQQNHQSISREEARLTQIRDVIQKFQADFLPQLTAVDAALQNEDFEAEARAELVRLDQQASQIGYDPDAHEAVRQSERLGRESEAKKRTVDDARATLLPLEREIGTLTASITVEQQSLERLQTETAQAEAEYQELKAKLPDKNALEREVVALKEQVNRKTSEVGGAQGRLKNLVNIRERQKALAAQRDEILRQISLLKKLEHAFSKDGVPALLIEQALPEIEEQANTLLERLSNGSMALKFETQADYKDAKRTDKKETLEIRISDSSGNYREYEMYSGGEAFRVNFAIRLALSKVLAHRAGARLQTLVIDEGFGSQDADGRQRLIEAINLVRSDFKKILVITHLEELKDAFPARIEVEKGSSGSTVRVQLL